MGTNMVVLNLLILCGVLTTLGRGEDSLCWTEHNGVCTLSPPTGFEMVDPSDLELCPRATQKCYFPKRQQAVRHFDSDICGLNTLEEDVYFGIINGNKTRPYEFPWLASLRTEDMTFCGGAILNERWVLTAAHCLQTWEADEITIYAGMVNSLDTESDNEYVQSSKVITMKLHEHFHSRHLLNDIGLLELATPLTFTDAVRPACLPLPVDKIDNSISKYSSVKQLLANKNRIGMRLPSKLWRQHQVNADRLLSAPRADDNDFDIDSKVFTVVGFGSTETGELSNDLLKLRAPGVPLNECAEQDRGAKTCVSMICAGFLEGGRDSCTGDSGGPLTVLERDQNNRQRAVLDGIVSSGFGCAERETPGYYARVSFYLDWIDFTTKEPLAYKDGRYSNAETFDFPEDEEIL